ncbi:MAG: DUF4031 domain-containing protein [Acidimicrobiales bacterium]
MTILVDQALWPWRDLRWAHLISDKSHHELHEFASLIGKRRVGFQGDHYDVHEVERERAIHAGAVEVDSRVLVQRLRQAGLRCRGGLPKWTVLHEAQTQSHEVSATVAAASLAGVSLALHLDRLAAPSPPPCTSVDLLILERPLELAAVVRGVWTIAQLDKQETSPHPHIEEWFGHDDDGPVLEVIYRPPGTK